MKRKSSVNTRQAATSSQFRFPAFMCAMLVVLQASLLLPANADAQVIDWNNPNNLNSWYDVAGNWVGGTPPGAAQTARFNLNNTYEVWWNSNTAANTPVVGFLRVLNGDVTFQNQDASPQYELTINGSGGSGALSSISISGAGSTLTNRGLFLHCLDFVEIINGATLTIDGSHSAGSRLSIDSIAVINGNLNVIAGGIASSQGGTIGYTTGSTGVATVSGLGSQWTDSSGFFVGHLGFGELNIEDGGVFSGKSGLIGSHLSGPGGRATVTGPGSLWNLSESLQVGVQSAGSLNVEAGGTVTSTSGIIGVTEFSPGGHATVTGAGSQWNNSGNLFVGSRSSGSLSVEAGGTVTCGGFGNIGYLASSTGAVTVSGAGSQWNNGGELRVGTLGNGILNIEASGVVSDTYALVGGGIGSTGQVTVTGFGSQWNNAGDSHIGLQGSGILNVEAGGTVSGVFGNIGSLSGSVGVATVTGPDSSWNNSADLFVGKSGNGTLNVEAGGLVANVNGVLGSESGSTGVATVAGTDSLWNHLNDLYVGLAGNGTLNIESGGKVSVGGTTSIGSLGTVNLSGAGSRFEFGQTSLGEFSNINATSGSMAGNLLHSGYTDVSSLTSLQNPNVDVSDVSVKNSGVLFGNGSLRIGLNNTAAGEVETVAGERMRFAGSGNTNAGEINNFGGQIRFAQDVTNQSGGLISGRGQFIADGGWNNSGVMALSGGFADVHGDLTNNADGLIVTTGGATTTFFDDVANQGEIRTSQSSNSVFLGGVTGDGSYTGTGTVFMEGDLRPGNSPNAVSFGGDLIFGTDASTFFELGGLGAGEFDQLLVSGDLYLGNSSLDVAMWNGFSLGSNMQFLIADVNGGLIGQYKGLGEGALVGTYGGTNLFITYNGFGGNAGVGLFTAVPEPGAVMFLGLIGLAGLVSCRFRRK